MKEHKRPTAERRKADVELVFKMLRKNNAAEYSEPLNPFEKGTLRFERFERIYKLEQGKWHGLDAVMDDFAEVYGEFRPDRLGLLKEINMSKVRKILSWIPIVGFWVELYCVLLADKSPYMSDRSHEIRFWLSGVYHGIMMVIPYFLLLIWFLS